MEGSGSCEGVVVVGWEAFGDEGEAEEEVEGEAVFPQKLIISLLR